ncbi:MAG: hypothetical protein BGO06_09070 [Shinella sp. 65-6]|nr:MAG: hypothetical protein BGO06_09070 [Shinella sp. 65-6]
MTESSCRFGHRQLSRFGRLRIIFRFIVVTWLRRFQFMFRVRGNGRSAPRFLLGLDPGERSLEHQDMGILLAGIRAETA